MSQLISFLVRLFIVGSSVVSKTTGSGSATGPVPSEGEDRGKSDLYSRGKRNKNKFDRGERGLTFTIVLEVRSNPFTVIDQRTLGVQVSGRTIGKRPMVKME